MFKIIMPPQKSTRGCIVIRNIEEPELPNAPEVQPQKEVSNVKFREVIRRLN